MRLEIIKRAEKERIIEKLREQFGIESLPYLLIRQGRDKIRAFSGSLSREEIETIGTETNVEIIGIYFLRLENDGFRLSIDATNLLSSQVKKNIIELDDRQIIQWMKGNSIEIDKNERGYKIIRHKEDFFGTGKAGNGILYNYVPKDRRIRN